MHQNAYYLFQWNENKNERKIEKKKRNEDKF